MGKIPDFMEEPPEFRQSLATKEWVILAPKRGERPSDTRERLPKKEPQPEYDPHCPFCVGNEAQTEKPNFILPSKKNWQVRVVPNKFAALDSKCVATRSSTGSFLSAKGFGIAEVVIEHPKHNLSPALMNNREVSNILKAYRQRQFEINKNENINLVTIFRNHGARAGTSLAHPHSQIIATPIVPPHVRYPMEQAISYYDMYGKCVYCEMVREEKRQKKRILAESENFIAFCPFASRSPFECRIYPKKHIPSFVLIKDYEIKELAAILRKVLYSLYKTLGDPDYNYIIRSAPIGDEDARYLHWYMFIVPKITIPAGFEIGSGIYINTFPPEEAARELRKITSKI
jgi:UDPglucose--hexose-1-phosphate uridylyltransferase